MRKGAFIINTARGPIIKKDDLFQSLKSGRIAGAALDVIENEPLKTKSEGNIPNLIVTPHCGLYSLESFWEMKYKAALTVKQVLSGKVLENNCINYKFLPRNFVK